jgi:hypothetical protein
VVGGHGVVIYDEGKETAMAEPWLDIVEKVTEFFASAQIEACARRTGFVRRASKIRGKVFLALVTLGAWSTTHDLVGAIGGQSGAVAHAGGHFA